MTPTHPLLLLRLLALTTLLLITSGCGELLDALPGTSISGTVYGESFSALSSTAEVSSDGTYFLTFSDKASYSCTSTPPGNYLTVVVGQVTTAGTLSAAGNVSFNLVEDGTTFTESASAGSVTIDRLDTDFDQVIEGSINAVGPSSDVAGRFSTPICN
ncbi:hypothetical protein DV096_11760 [Bradymonadaceae bacterium TMQ3]|uniref:Carboxypeptidase regulatory-like domain-containing protein n=1 Tax=Lujinxingia sediminis TaxID=2480984 RepID=A0ABY0CSB8_9DELT|nr:hypothetical protein [Lujinxingia sediminis]RDV37787.1 hypothetical protein DV096_11760 [Bradymonadaceae bacterium TMQ3]RVU43192.1 hypothetical protein EA187_13350 [Lujinxingia sediminis]TXC75429.1 hypothetical protein FRC91_11990 [Bradymonadales bacterium TMQ1]